MIFSKFNISFLFIIIFLSSCSSMNVTEETVYSGDVKTVQASSADNEDISYDSQAVFANATVYFDFDKTNLTSKSLQTLKSIVDALNDNSQLNIVLSGHAVGSLPPSHPVILSPSHPLPVSLFNPGSCPRSSQGHILNPTCY